MPGVVCPICGYGRIGDEVDPPCLSDGVTIEGEAQYAVAGCLFFAPGELDE